MYRSQAASSSSYLQQKPCAATEPLGARSQHWCARKRRCPYWSYKQAWDLLHTEGLCETGERLVSETTNQAKPTPETVNTVKVTISSIANYQFCCRCPPDEQPLVSVDHVQQQPLVCIRQLCLVLLLVLQVQPRLLQPQPKARNLQDSRQHSRRGENATGLSGTAVPVASATAWAQGLERTGQPGAQQGSTAGVKRSGTGLRGTAVPVAPAPASAEGLEPAGRPDAQQGSTERIALHREKK